MDSRTILKKILPFTYSVRYYVNILTKNNEIKVISFGRGLKNIISDNKQLLKLRSNWHLNVKIEKINKFNSFDKSYPIEMDWIYPVSDLNSKEEWLLFLEKNQPDLESFIKERNIYNKRDELAQVFGNDLISELISKERDEKINKLIDI